MTLTGFFLGFFLGVMIGILVMAIMRIAKESDGG